MTHSHFYCNNNDDTSFLYQFVGENRYLPSAKNSATQLNVYVEQMISQLCTRNKINVIKFPVNYSTALLGS